MLIRLPAAADPVLAAAGLDPVVDEVLLLLEELHAVAIMANAHTAAPAASFWRFGLFMKPLRFSGVAGISWIAGLARKSMWTGFGCASATHRHPRPLLPGRRRKDRCSRF